MGRPSPPPPASVYQPITVRCVVTFDRATLVGDYATHFEWVEPIVSLMNKTVYVFNRNPVAIAIHIDVLDVNTLAIVKSYDARVEPSSMHIVTTSTLKPGRYKVRVYYTFLGVFRGQSIDVSV